MYRKSLLFLFLTIFVASVGNLCAQEEISNTEDFVITQFLTEQLPAPEGIDTQHPTFSWKIQSSANNESQSAYELKLYKVDADDVVWDSGKVESDQQSFVPYTGDPLTPATAYQLELTVWNKDGSLEDTVYTTFSTGLWATEADPNPWKGKWIGMNETVWETADSPAVYMSKSFTLPATKEVKRAMAYIVGLGYYELYLDSIRVGDHTCDPIFTEYGKRVAYNTYDVTEQLALTQDADSEENTSDQNVNISVALGNGWYFPPRQADIDERFYGLPSLLFQLEVEYTDGTKDCIVSDETWKGTLDGPIIENNIYNGEYFDARKEVPYTPGMENVYTEMRDGVVYAVPTTDPVVLMTPPQGEIVAQMMCPMRVSAEIEPKSVTEVRPGVWLFDFGQNFVGWCRLAVQGNAGTAVVLRFAETLQTEGEDAGRLYTDNLRSARCCDHFILGDSEETQYYEPRFTFHGFRYVEVTGFPGTPDKSTLTGCVMSTDLPLVGMFECSNPTITQFVKNIEWGVRGNYLSVPTDCPQRDERLGWMGDRVVGSRGEMYLFDNITLYRKWMQDIEDCQNEEGNVSDVAPAEWEVYHTNVTWPSVMLAVPESLHLIYGDTRSIIKHYDSRKKWLEHLNSFVKEDGTIDKDNYGDWCVPPEEEHLIHSEDPARTTDPGLLATAYYIFCLKIMAKDAKMLGKLDDEQLYLDRAAAAKEAFNKAFYNEEKGCYMNGSQTSSVLPLAFDIVPPENRDKVFAALVNNLENITNRHIGTGVLGCQWINRVLSDNGRIDLAYTLSTNRDYPSWGYMIENGATTVWELWNGNTADPAMNSGNHVMLIGDAMIWYMEYLAGISSDRDQLGFKRLIMKPNLVGDLEWVTARYDSIRGEIASQWKRDGKKITWNVQIPVGSTALISLPTSKADTVQVEDNNGAVSIDSIQTNNNRAEFELGSGSWAISAELD